VVNGRRDEYLGWVELQAVLDRIQETTSPWMERPIVTMIEGAQSR